METKGLFKRIAAITMAALTIVTSSGVDVNLLTANANELQKSAHRKSCHLAQMKHSRER